MVLPITVRAATLLVEHTAGPHFQDRLFEAADIARERIYHLNVLEDGSMVLLGRVSGNLDQLERTLAVVSDALSYTVSRQGDGSALVFLHASPPPAVRRLLELPRTHEVFFDFPIEGAGDGRLRVDMIAETNAMLQAALTDAPDGVEVTVERLGPYPTDDIEAILTDRQQEVLTTARELGYYDVPRNVTHQEIADRLDLSVATVGEHLQKIEARVFETLVG